MRKDFEEVYKEICENGGNEFVIEYKKNISMIIKCFIISIVVSIVLFYIAGVNIAGCFLILGCLILFFSMLKLQDKYLKKYKEIIITKLIKLYNPKLNYNSDFGFKENDYKKSNLPEKFDEFKSRDSIYGKISEYIDFKLAYIITYRKERVFVDDVEKIERIETFKGMFGACRISKNINSELIIDLNDFKRKYSLNRVELESLDFEKSFDCFSNNKIKALQILTPDVIEKINELCSRFKNSFQLRIHNNMIFFRFSLEDLFAPPKFKNPLDKERIKKLYDAVYLSDNIVECIFESIYENI